MNDEEVRRLLGRLADRADVGPAPVGDLVRAGRSAERRKRRATIFGAAIASLAIIVVGFAVDQSVSRDRPGNVGVSATSPSAASSLPPVVDGTRLVGMGRVVVAVPDTWGTGEVRCGQPLRDTVYFPSDGNRSCLGVPGAPASSVGIASTSSDTGRRATKRADTSGTINGIPVAYSERGCETSDPPVCSQVVTVPSQGVVLILTAPETSTIATIVDSLRLLPEGYTTVRVDPNGPLENTVDLIEAAGLDAQVVEKYRKGWSAGVLLDSDPAAGTVLATGETVTLTVSSGESTAPKLSRCSDIPPDEPPSDHGADTRFAPETQLIDVWYTLEGENRHHTIDHVNDETCAEHPTLSRLISDVLGTAVENDTDTSPSPGGFGADPTTKPFRLYTHCGVESARIDGRWWHAKPPLYNEDRSGPPDGWDNPFQHGRLTVESPNRAVFKAAGQRVVFVPAPDNQPVRVCR
jgi:hypothetical protein